MTERRPFTLGLTGSIGMGKSTTANMFAQAGVPVWDADAAVHRLYAAGGLAVPGIGALHPAAVVDGAVDRGILKTWIANDETALSQIEKVVHPLVAQDRAAFLQTHSDAEVVVFDIPLLFEIGAQDWLDGVAVVSTDENTQKARVLARPGMTLGQLDLILSRQLPDAEKRARADFIIPTDTLDGAQKAVHSVISQIKETQRDA